MKRHTSRNSCRDAKPKPQRDEDSGAVLRARTEEERRRRRRDWMIEQEKMDWHNRLKKKMAMEYEIRRAFNMGLALSEGRCNRSCRSRSESPPSRCRRTSMQRTPEDAVLSKKFEIPSGTMPLFKGSEGTKINPIELRKIKVDIHRNIPGSVATNELKRDIPNKEDVVLKRRAGEGSKPIFDREEIRRAIGETEEVEERRSVVTVNLENSENKLKALKRRERPRDHSRDRRQADRFKERDRFREQRVPREHYIQPIPIPTYCGNFQPRPKPWGPIRGPLVANKEVRYLTCGASGERGKPMLIHGSSAVPTLDKKKLCRQKCYLHVYS